MSWKMSGRVKEIRYGMKGQPITRTDKLVMLVLADYYNEKTKTSWPSLDTLAEECLSSKVSLWRSLTRLEKLGLLKSQVGRWREPEYALLPNGDPPLHFNLKPDSDFKSSAITFQNEGDHISKQAESQSASIKNQVLTEREPKDKGPLALEPGRPNPKPVKEPKVRRGFEKPTARVSAPAKVITNKQPESWIWFSKTFNHLAEKNPYSHPDLWPLVEEMLREIGEDEAEERLSIYIDGADKVTGWTAKEFLEGGWRTIDPADFKMPRLTAPEDNFKR